MLSGFQFYKVTTLNWILLYLVLAMVYTIHEWEKEKDEIPLIMALVLFWIYPVMDLFNWLRYHYLRTCSIILLKRIRRKLKREGASKEDIQKITDTIDLI